jgi:exonuclease VII large subunit
MDFASILADAVARQGAPTPFADAVAAFEQHVARVAITAAEAPAWARVLRVTLPCTEQELRAAFRRRAFETHPDRASGSHAAFLRTKTALDEGLQTLRAG